MKFSNYFKVFYHVVRTHFEMHILSLVFWEIDWTSGARSNFFPGSLKNAEGLGGPFRDFFLSLLLYLI